jgi:transcriptional regulator with XRE-family HTH domain
MEYSQMESIKRSDRIKRIGNELRQLRLKHNPQKLTLQEVAEAVGYSTATLSQIERGVIAPSIQGLLKLADFYKISPASFFDEAEEGNVIVNTPDNRDKIKGEFNESFEILYNNMELNVLIMRGVVPTGAESGNKLHKRDYSEFLYICSGSVRVVLETKEYELNEGASIFIEANTPFRFVTDGKEGLEGIFIYFGKKK